MAVVEFDNVPAALRERPQWVLWSSESRGGKPTKIPFQRSGDLARSDDPSTWTTFEAAESAYDPGRHSGIGFVFSPDDPFCGIDLDGCRDPETGQVAEWAREVIIRFSSYAEVSPSGTGVKIFCIAANPFGRGRKTQPSKLDRVCDKTPAIEIYDRGRYFAVTGLRLRGPTEPTEANGAIAWLKAAYWPDEAAEVASAERIDFRSEAAVVERARKYLSKIPGAVSGQRGHDATFHAACILVLGFELPSADAIAILLEWNQRCEPPWSEREIARKVSEAAKQTGRRGYLRNAAPQTWPRVDVPQYSCPMGPATNGWTWNLIDSATFARGNYRPTWIVKRMIVDREPLILGGAEKTLKTTIAAELAVSISAGLPFLGRFDVYKPRSVAFISGESGAFTLQETFFRIAAAKGVDPGRCLIHWGFDLPSLADGVDLAEIEDGVRRLGIGLVIIDPAYLAVLRGQDPNDAKNFFAMGGILSAFTATCIRAGATPAIVHHANRSLPPGERMELHHLSYGGFSQFAAQWLLLSRRTPYEANGRHELLLNAGGRCGQGGLYSIDVDEGTIGDEFEGRKWAVTIEPAGEQRQREQAERETDRELKKATKARKDAEDLHRRWLEQPDRIATKAHMRGVMGGWSGDRMNLTIAFLVDRRQLLPCEAEVPSGRGGSKLIKTAGFIAVRATCDDDGERVGKGG